MKSTIPFLIRRCLALKVQISPYELNSVLNQYESKPIPDSDLEKADFEFLKKYVKGLYFCDHETADAWVRGHDILLELGFKKTERIEGHRAFVKLEWAPESNR